MSRGTGCASTTEQASPRARNMHTREEWHALVIDAASRCDEDTAYELAGELGYAACRGLDLAELEALVEKRAAANDGYAQLALSYLLQRRNDPTAEDWLRRAAANHIHQAQFLLSHLVGVDDDCDWLAEYMATSGFETESFVFQQLEEWLAKQAVAGDARAEQLGDALDIALTY